MNLLRRDKIYRRINIVIIAIFLLVLGIYLFSRYSGPSSIGEFSYIGKSETGCYIACPWPPSWIYYFATDLDEKEVTRYIEERQAHLTKSDNSEHYFGYYPTGFVFENAQKEQFVITFYDAKASQFVRNRFNLGQVTKPHTIEISDISIDGKKSDFAIFKETMER